MGIVSATLTACYTYLTRKWSQMEKERLAPWRCPLLDQCLSMGPTSIWTHHCILWKRSYDYLRFRMSWNMNWMRALLGYYTKSHEFVSCSVVLDKVIAWGRIWPTCLIRWLVSLIAEAQGILFFQSAKLRCVFAAIYECLCALFIAF